MTWDKPHPDARYIDRDCRRFRINRAYVNGTPVYQAARVIPQPSVVVLGCGSLAECKQACEEAA